MATLGSIPSLLMKSLTWKTKGMKSNVELTMKDFHISNNIKRAILNIENPSYAKEFLIAALRTVHSK